MIFTFYISHILTTLSYTLVVFTYALGFPALKVLNEKDAYV